MEPLYPTKHPLLYWLDHFRDLRLMWVGVDAILGLVTLGLVTWLYFKMRRMNKDAHHKHQKLAALVEEAARLAKDVNRRLDDKLLV